MAARLQVILEDEEMDEIREAAERQRLTVSESVRRALRRARRRYPIRDEASKLAVIRAAVRHRFPTAGIETMLEEIQPDHSEKDPGDTESTIGKEPR